MREVRFYVARKDDPHGFLSNLDLTSLLVPGEWRLRVDNFFIDGAAPLSDLVGEMEAKPDGKSILVPFNSAEHAYQWMKPVAGHKGHAIAEWIRAAPFPRLAAHAAHHLSPYDVRREWNEIKVPWMRVCLRAKFDPVRNPHMAAKLLATGDATLIEASPGKDKTSHFWGVGHDGTGENYLGMLLMAVRTELEVAQRAAAVA